MILDNFSPDEIRASLVTSDNLFELAALQRAWDKLQEDKS